MKLMVRVIHRAGTVRPRALPLVVNETGIEIGRALSCDLCLEDTERVISHRHARIHEAQGQLWVTDLSRNGTLLNEKPLPSGQPAALKDGDWLTIGAYEIRIGLDTGLDESTPPQPAVVPDADLKATALVDPAQGAVHPDRTQALTAAQTAVLGEVTQRPKGAGCAQPGPKTSPQEDRRVCLDGSQVPLSSGDQTAVLAQRTQLPSSPPAEAPTQVVVQPPEPGRTQVLAPAAEVTPDALIDAVMATIGVHLDPARWEHRLVGHAGLHLSQEEQARCWQGFKAAYPELLREIRAALVERWEQR